MIVGETVSKRLIPIQYNAKTPPLVAWKPFTERDPTPEEVQAWNRLPRCNWALITGRASGCIVLDVDTRRGGLESLRRHPTPHTLVIKTPSGGFHYYFQYPRGGCATAKDFEPGLEIRADNAYVLVPPSTINGGRYEIVSDAPTAPVPDWLRAIIQRADWPAQAGHGSGQWQAAFHHVPQGQQNVLLASLCGHFAKSLPEHLWPAIPDLLWAVARRYPQHPHDPWTRADMAHIAHSICQRESRARGDRITIRVLE